MKRRPLRQTLMLLLGILIALGTGFSSVQAGGMAVDMALASDEGMPGHGGCDGCPGDAGASGACPAVCTLAVTAVVPSAPVPIMPGSRLPAPPVAVDASGWSSPPDPSPPKDESAG